MQRDKDILFVHPVYRSMKWLEKYMDRYYVDPILGFILPGGLGDTLSSLLALPFIYYSLFVVKSVPLTLAVTVNILRDILLGLIPFFVGDIFDCFFRSYGRNLRLITGYVNGDRKTVTEVRRKTALSVVVIIVLLLLIILLVKIAWMLGAWLIGLFS